MAGGGEIVNLGPQNDLCYHRREDHISGAIKQTTRKSSNRWQHNWSEVISLWQMAEIRQAELSTVRKLPYSTVSCLLYSSI